jgi:hypothetical protein
MSSALFLAPTLLPRHRILQSGNIGRSRNNLSQHGRKLPLIGISKREMGTTNTSVATVGFVRSRNRQSLERNVEAKSCKFVGLRFGRESFVQSMHCVRSYRCHENVTQLAENSGKSEEKAENEGESTLRGVPPTW